jgi:2-C-methyl-D-erythritol 4-phosphate cytidylyltransferase/2-C-methyl-D-erythritol 2,4-cyclodiphosphate synthase
MPQPENRTSLKSSISIVLVAAGRGARAGGLVDGPKQYRKIGGQAVIARTIQTFLDHEHINQIMIVTHPDDDDLIADAISAFNADRLLITHGGATRQHSVLNGLNALQPTDYVLIHDAVRPFVTRDVIDDTINELLSGSQAVLPALAVSDTLKRVDGQSIITQTVSRDHLYAAQTPQGFAYNAIYNAHIRAQNEGRTDFTDDCAIAEWANIPVKIIKGSSKNIKLTTIEDINMANHSLPNAVFADVRTGNGYDVHQLIDGGHVTLCGVDIPHHKRLSGHSDADVALHALTDALLATCGAGDIGDHFPPTDPQWKGAASFIFLEKAAEIVREKGGIITNADVSLIAEQPKIGPHRDKMRASLANILNIDIERCSVKATTNEKIGFIGREEGIAAIATATVVYGVTS